MPPARCSSSPPPATMSMRTSLLARLSLPADPNTAAKSRARGAANRASPRERARDPGRRRELPSCRRPRRRRSREIAAFLERIVESRRELGHFVGETARAAANLDQPLLVTVMGEFSSGKSSFVNAFIGADVAPTGITPTTATINVVRYGRERGGRIITPDGATARARLGRADGAPARAHARRRARDRPRRDPRAAAAAREDQHRRHAGPQLDPARARGDRPRVHREGRRRRLGVHRVAGRQGEREEGAAVDPRRGQARPRRPQQGRSAERHPRSPRSSSSSAARSAISSRRSCPVSARDALEHAQGQATATGPHSRARSRSGSSSRRASSSAMPARVRSEASSPRRRPSSRGSASAPSKPRMPRRRPATSSRRCAAILRRRCRRRAQGAVGADGACCTGARRARCSISCVRAACRSRRTPRPPPTATI